MSWSFNGIGTPAKLGEALDKQSAGMSAGASKTEFDDALPHIKALLSQNHRLNPEFPALMSLAASGSGSTSGGVEQSRSCVVKIEALYGSLHV